ncbi:tRNA 5-methylaminomethyl-2-thiouridine biosynthesis bifunctional protein [Caenispirillum bisanense]|uniref:tRNA 5-methylaminomethyl-2-thiouridine biosynthesis bifunctional protein n=1 Tax=Caenispirillum bisanense TaxID=414052 RepID=A0A286GNI3_9PROT|nr:tRNA 5-methylaminomethyl-2-thiouridine biosynthesis bifunctional protein [Caenispirillum bisanense]
MVSDDMPTDGGRMPWFRRADPAPAGPVAVLGGGIGGTAVADALRRAGREAVILEAGPALARDGSGNPSALMKPRLTPDGHPYGRFHAQAWLHALHRYDALPAAVWREGRGVLAAARDAAEVAEQEHLVAALRWPAEEVRRVDAVEALALSGCPTPLGGLWFGRAGCLHPQLLCPALAAGCEVRTGVRVAAFARAGDGWVLRDDGGAPILEAAAVVLAAGAALPELWPAADWPLGKSRGQITFLPASEAGPRRAVSFGGYLTAPFTDEDGRPIHALGATYDRWRHRPDDWRPVRPEDHARNLALLAEHLPDAAARLGAEPIGGRAGLRCTIPDHMPLAGPVHDAAAFRTAFADLHHGRRPQAYPPAPYVPGLFVLGALGSRGFQTAPLAAEVVAAEITGAPCPVDADIAAALHPARFEVRHLKHPPQRRAVEEKKKQKR